MISSESRPDTRTARSRGPSPDKTSRTRRLIIDAAMEEFLERGYAKATMSGIAMRAGLAKGTAYRYFDTKEALFAAAVRLIVADPLAEVSDIPPLENESCADYCRRTLLPLMRRIEQSGRAGVARLVLTEGRAFPYLADVYRAEVYRPFISRLSVLAKRADERGELKCDALLSSPQLLAAPLWMGIIHNGFMEPDSPVDVAALFESQIELAFGA